MPRGHPSKRGVAHVIRKIEKPSLDECKAKELSDEVLGFDLKCPENGKRVV